VQVPYDEGVANHIDPESCAVAREGLGEALTGECIGQPFWRESKPMQLAWLLVAWLRTHASSASNRHHCLL
jgi:hypothetical protein